MGGGIFALRRPRPYSRHCEEIVAGMQRRLQFVPMGASTGTANKGITPRRYVLRETGELVLGRRVPKRDRGEMPVRVQFLGGFSLLARK